MSQNTLFRAPTLSDAAPLWALVRATGVLEPNSAYAYLLLSTHFASTGMVAERDGRLVGFVSAYVPPSRPDAVFVWQIGVHPDAQGAGLGRRMLLELLARPACASAKYLEATVGVSNRASERLFRSVARILETGCEVTPWFLPEHFPASESGATAHEAEPLYRIGPLRR